MIGLNDHKLDLIRKLSEIDNHYKISEKNARDMMSDAVSTNEDSILKLSHDKWNIKKTIEDNKYDTMNLESKLKKKRQIYQENDSELTNQTNNLISSLSSIINKLQTQLEEKSVSATLLQQEIEEYCAHYEI
ncbi:hypothetical protein MXB_749 [Myxobolus squamalis]|nr:hypothetical protein MXB_749 [Myxobolus squamalis]